MHLLLLPLVGGLLGTLVMTLFLFVPRWLNWGRVDVIRAAGALVTGKTENAMGPGLGIHIVSGILFAYVYTWLLSLSQLPLNVWTFAMAGAIHGIIVMLLVSVVIMEHHPVARYHERGPMTGLAQLLAHILYGATLGLVYQTFDTAA